MSGLRAVVYHWIALADPDTAAFLHDANQPKPFVISPIHHERGAELSFTLAITADWLTELFLRGVRLGGPHIELGRRPFRLLEMPEVVREIDWHQLQSGGEHAYRWRLRLLTPTAHHAAGALRKAVPLPSPENYFGTWLSRWSLLTDQPANLALRQLVEDRVIVSDCSGATKRVELGKERVFVGFVGDVTFEIRRPGEVPYAHRQALNAAVRLSEFCGTGVETLSGMGQTMLLE